MFDRASVCALGLACVPTRSITPFWHPWENDQHMSVHTIITLNTKGKQNPNFILQLCIPMDHSDPSLFDIAIDMAGRRKFRCIMVMKIHNYG